MPEPVGLRDRIGGARAVSWQYGAFVVAISTLAFPYATRVTGPEQFPVYEILALVLAADLVAVLLIPLVATTIFRHRRQRPVPIWSVFLFGVAVVLVREVVLQQLFDSAGLEIVGSVMLRLIALGIISGAFAVGFALLLDELDQLRRAINKVNERLVTLRVRERLSTQLAAQIELAAQTEIAAATDDVLTQLDEAVGTADRGDRLAAAEDLRAFVDTRLRPLSLELYEMEDEAPPQVRVRDVLGGCLRARPLRPLLTATVFGLVIFVYQLPQYPIEAALLQAATHAGLVALALWIVALAARRGIVRGAALPAGVLIAIAATSAKTLLLGTESVGSGVLIASGAWLVAAVVGIGLLDAIFSGRTVALTSIQATLDTQTVNTIAEQRELVQASRDLATYVHGTLQSTLLATAFAIEDANRTGDAERLADALRDARSALNALIAARDQPAGDLGSELAARASLWRGYLDVTIHVDCDAELPPGLITFAGGVVQEALANARKHGRAAHARVTATATDAPSLVLTVTDDGIGPQRGGRGLGSRQLDAACPGGWTLTNGADGSGAHLQVELPLPTVAHRGNLRTGTAGE